MKIIGDNASEACHRTLKLTVSKLSFKKASSSCYATGINGFVRTALCTAGMPRVDREVVQAGTKFNSTPPSSSVGGNKCRYFLQSRILSLFFFNDVFFVFSLEVFFLSFFLFHFFFFFFQRGRGHTFQVVQRQRLRCLWSAPSSNLTVMP